MTPAEVSGAAPLTACAAGYHMASLWEILDPTALQYETSLGFGGALFDTGSGPPTVFVAWVRTGNLSSTTGGSGSANCGGWTNPDIGDFGTAAGLPGSWDSSLPLDPRITPWEAQTVPCILDRRVWCIED